MSDLFAEIVAVVKGDASTAILSEEFGVASPEAAGNASALSVPIVVVELIRWAHDLTASYRLFERIRAYDLAKLGGERGLLEAGLYHSSNNDLIDDLLEERRQIVGDHLADEAKINKQSAQGILAATAGFVLATITRRYGPDIDRHVLLTLLEDENKALVDAGWQPWLDKVNGVVREPARVPTPNKPAPPAANPETPAMQTQLSVPTPDAPVRQNASTPAAGFADMQQRSEYSAPTEPYQQERYITTSVEAQDADEEWEDSRSVALRVLVFCLAALAFGLACYLLFSSNDSNETAAALFLGNCLAV